jgi:hypothetical protein
MEYLFCVSSILNILNKLVQTNSVLNLHTSNVLYVIILIVLYRYLLHEKLSVADHARTHIFSSFFYKRLTQRIRGAAIDDDPNVT